MELIVDNQRLISFTKFEVVLAFASLSSSFSFNMRLDPNNTAHRQITEYGTYPIVKVSESGEKLVTGVIENQRRKADNKKELIAVGGRSIPGVLNDCNVPIELYPLQTIGLSPLQIITRLCNYWGIRVINESNEPTMTQRLDEQDFSETASVGAIINELCSERNVVASHNANGDVVLVRPNTEKAPVLTLTDANNIPIEEITANFNGNEIYSSTVVVSEADDDKGIEGAQSSAINRLIKAKRPTVRVQKTGNEFDVDRAVKTAIDSQKRAFSLGIILDRWRINDVILRPGDIISVKNDEVGLHKPYNFFLESCKFAKDAEKETLELSCVLPEVYGGKRQSLI